MARILLVDDEEHIRRLYTEELSEEGHQVWTAATGHDLLGRIDRQRSRVPDSGHDRRCSIPRSLSASQSLSP